MQIIRASNVYRNSHDVIYWLLSGPRNEGRWPNRVEKIRILWSESWLLRLLLSYSFMTRMMSDVGNFEGAFHPNKNGPKELSFHDFPPTFPTPSTRYG